MLRSLMAKVKVLKVLAPVVWSATASLTGVDTQDFGSLMFSISVGAFATFDDTNYVNIIVQHSDTDVDGDYVNCTADEMRYGNNVAAEDGANGVVYKLNADGDAGAVHLVHYLGEKRFIRIRLVEGGTVSTPIGVNATLGDCQQMPPA